MCRRSGGSRPTGQREAQREDGGSRRLARLSPRRRLAVAEGPRGAAFDVSVRATLAAPPLQPCGAAGNRRAGGRSTGRPTRGATGPYPGDLTRGHLESGRPEARGGGHPPAASKVALPIRTAATTSPRELSRARCRASVRRMAPVPRRRGSKQAKRLPLRSGLFRERTSLEIKRLEPPRRTAPAGRPPWDTAWSMAAKTITEKRDIASWRTGFPRPGRPAGTRSSGRPDPKTRAGRVASA